jgi:hypothetical protein
VAWVVATAIAIALAGSAWRGSRPFDVIRVNRRFGFEQVHSRWMVWLPTVMLALFGIALTSNASTRPTIAAFLLFWLVVAVAISVQYARALKRSRRSDHG